MSNEEVFSRFRAALSAFPPNEATPPETLQDQALRRFNQTSKAVWDFGAIAEETGAGTVRLIIGNTDLAGRYVFLEIIVSKKNAQTHKIPISVQGGLLTLKLASGNQVFEESNQDALIKALGDLIVPLLT